MWCYREWNIDVFDTILKRNVYVCLQIELNEDICINQNIRLD